MTQTPANGHPHKSGRLLNVRYAKAWSSTYLIRLLLLEAPNSQLPPPPPLAKNKHNQTTDNRTRIINARRIFFSLVRGPPPPPPPPRDKKTHTHTKKEKRKKLAHEARCCASSRGNDLRAEEPVVHLPDLREQLAGGDSTLGGTGGGASHRTTSAQLRAGSTLKGVDEG